MFKKQVQIDQRPAAARDLKNPLAGSHLRYMS